MFILMNTYMMNSNVCRAMRNGQHGEFGQQTQSEYYVHSRTCRAINSTQHSSILTFSDMSYAPRVREFKYYFIFYINPPIISALMRPHAATPRAYEI